MQRKTVHIPHDVDDPEELHALLEAHKASYEHTLSALYEQLADAQERERELHNELHRKRRLLGDLFAIFLRQVTWTRGPVI